MGYICCCCGHISNSATSGRCNKSKSGYHEYIEKRDDGYICCGCGHLSNFATGGSCQKSPSGNHWYM